MFRFIAIFKLSILRKEINKKPFEFGACYAQHFPNDLK